MNLVTREQIKEVEQKIYSLTENMFVIDYELVPESGLQGGYTSLSKKTLLATTQTVAKFHRKIQTYDFPTDHTQTVYYKALKRIFDSETINWKSPVYDQFNPENL